MKKSCNECAKDFCVISKSPLKIMEERNGDLKCFVPPNRRVWKFGDLVSRVDIKDVNNPVIQMLKGV